MPGKLSDHAAKRVGQDIRHGTHGKRRSGRAHAGAGGKGARHRGVRRHQRRLSWMLCRSSRSSPVSASATIRSMPPMRANEGVMVTNTPDVLTEEVADTALGLLINTVRELPRAENYLREGRWVKEGPYRLTPSDAARPQGRHLRHGQDRAGDRAPARGVRPAGRLSQSPAGRGAAPTSITRRWSRWRARSIR